ncbi:peroxide stress protein YaaA [Longimycelium tulufanense]|uniref:Peroxide stress protein YaaA n=1 Tax=Longimycelium tulufanense TaxID=907463 RepID=A0A8J3FSR2_9PSEU|nr:peroxide stress protein YaaA [Longimycelium tulufanense]GGM38678.1 peroxide stress protein YaaA [Longimycelium tulufanense]
MLVLLPPSETKAAGGHGDPLDLDSLSTPELTPVRRKLVDVLVELAADVPASLAALGLSARQEAEVRRNAALRTAPTMPALRRYTGVLYDALDVPSMSVAELGRAEQRLSVGSALFGLVRGGDEIPAYRLSAASVLPAVGPLRELWRPVLEPMLSTVDDLVVDLRSGAYAALARVPHAVTVRVVSEDGAGRRKTVSHHNKAYKGKLARVLGTARGQVSTVDGIRRIAEKAGIVLEQTGDRALDLVVTG